MAKTPPAPHRAGEGTVSVSEEDAEHREAGTGYQTPQEGLHNKPIPQPQVMTATDQNDLKNTCFLPGKLLRSGCWWGLSRTLIPGQVAPLPSLMSKPLQLLLTPSCCSAAPAQLVPHSPAPRNVPVVNFQALAAGIVSDLEVLHLLVVVKIKAVLLKLLE